MDFQTTLTQLHHQIQLQPLEITPRLALVNFHTQHRQLPEALAQLQRALKDFGQHVELWNLFGKVKILQHDLVTAQFAYARAIACETTNFPAHAGMGRVLTIKGQLPKALEHYRLALVHRLAFPSTVVEKPQSGGLLGDAPLQLLWQTLALLGKTGIHAFATSGTLLGLVREGQLLSRDKDLDIALPYQAMNEAIACLTGAGWQLGDNEMQLANPIAMSHPQQNVVLDLCGLAKDSSTGRMISGFWRSDLPQTWWRIIEYPSPLTVQPAEGPAGPYWQLENPESLLAALYGPDWRTPDPDFDAVVAAYNERGFALVTQCYALYRIIWHWHGGRLRKALATTCHALRKGGDDSLLISVREHLIQAIAKNPVMATDVTVS